MYSEIKIIYLEEVNKGLDTLLFLHEIKSEGISKVVYNNYEITYWPELNKFYVGKGEKYQHLSYDEVELFLSEGKVPEKTHAPLAGDFGWSFH